jgi:hypothetical protein
MAVGRVDRKNITTIFTTLESSMVKTDAPH